MIYKQIKQLSYEQAKKQISSDDVEKFKKGSAVETLLHLLIYAPMFMVCLLMFDMMIFDKISDYFMILIFPVLFGVLLVYNIFLLIWKKVKTYLFLKYFNLVMLSVISMVNIDYALLSAVMSDYKQTQIPFPILLAILLLGSLIFILMTISSLRQALREYNPSRQETAMEKIAMKFISWGIVSIIIFIPIYEVYKTFNQNEINDFTQSSFGHYLVLLGAPLSGCLIVAGIPYIFISSVLNGYLVNKYYDQFKVDYDLKE